MKNFTKFTLQISDGMGFKSRQFTPGHVLNQNTDSLILDRYKQNDAITMTISMLAATATNLYITII